MRCGTGRGEVREHREENEGNFSGNGGGDGWGDGVEGSFNSNPLRTA